MDGNLRLGGQGLRIAAWSVVLLVAIFVFFLIKRPPIPSTLAVAEPVGEQKASGYVYLAGRWYDLDGQPLVLNRDDELIVHMLAPLHNGDLLLSSPGGQVWRCRQDLADCRPWAGDIEPRNRFQLVEMDDGNIVLLSHTPRRLYLLDRDGAHLDSRVLQSSRASLSRLDNRVFMTSGGHKTVRALTVEGNAFGTMETVMDLSQQSPISGHDYPHRLRRVGGHWWLSLLGLGDHPRIAVLDDQWNLVETHAVRVDGRITDWLVDEHGRLLLASNQHKLFRHDLSSGETTLLFQAQAGPMVMIHDNFFMIIVLFIVLSSLGILVLVLRAQARMEPDAEGIRKFLDESRKQFDAESVESMRHAGPVWLSPGKRVSRAARWWALGWKLAPVWSGALLIVSVAFASRVYERSESLTAAAVFAIAMILIIIQSLVNTRAEHKSCQQELGVEGKALLLRDPAGRVRRFPSGDLLFDGDRLLIDRVTKKVFQRHLSMSSPTLENRHFLYVPAVSQISLKSVLDEVPVVTTVKMNQEISRRRNHRLLDRAVIVAVIALPFTHFL